MDLAVKVVELLLRVEEERVATRNQSSVVVSALEVTDKRFIATTCHHVHYQRLMFKSMVNGDLSANGANVHQLVVVDLESVRENVTIRFHCKFTFESSSSCAIQFLFLIKETAASSALVATLNTKFATNSRALRSESLVRGHNGWQSMEQTMLGTWRNDSAIHAKLKLLIHQTWRFLSSKKKAGTVPLRDVIEWQKLRKKLRGAVGPTFLHVVSHVE